MLNRLRVKNFKSLRNLDITLRQRNVFIGRNSSGKSSILSVLSYLTQLLSSDAATIFGGAAGFQQHLWKGAEQGSISFEIWGDDGPTDVPPIPFNYSLSIAMDVQTGPIIESEFLSIGDDPAQTLIQAEAGVGTAKRSNGETIFTNPQARSKPFLSYEIPGWEGDRIRKYILGWQFFQLIPELSKRTTSQTTAHRFLDPNGMQISGWLHTFQANYPEAFSRVLSVAKEAFPEIESLTTPVTQAGTYLATSEKDLLSPVTIFYASDGEIKFLQLLSIIFSPFDVGVVAIEEPESHLHPRLIELLVEAADNVRLEFGDKGAQVFATTHSPYLVDKLSPEDVVVVDKVRGETICTRAADKADIRRMLEEGELGFGRLWYSGALGGV